jgi:imidazolonepropionase-like amidohydrolase
MKRYTLLVMAATLFGVIAGCSSEEASGDEGAQEQPAVDVTFFSGARLIPGDGSAPIEEATFIVENGKFTAIGGRNEVKPPKGAGRVELNGQTVMPVLFNLHGHVGLNNGSSFGPENYKRESVTADLNRYGYYGVAAVAIQGSDAGDLATQIRDEQTQNKLAGSRIFTGGRGFTAKGGFPTALEKDIPLQVSTEAEARKGVADQAAAKVDFISMWVEDNMGRAPKLRPEVYRAIIDEAHKHNLKAYASVFSLADAKDLVNSGIDGLTTSIRDREVDDELIALMKQKNVFYTPALTSAEARFVYADKPNWLGEQTMREVYPAQLSAYLADTVTVNRFNRNPDLAALRQQFATAKRNLKKLSDGGVKIALGTDSGSPDTYPGYFELRELVLMADAGMSPANIIKAASANSAEALGLKDQGTLVVGKKGDFFVLSSNPLEKIENAKEISVIYMNGAELDRGSLIQNITIEVPRITAKDRAEDAAAQARAAQEAAEAKMEHFGKFVLGPAANVRGVPIPTPKGSKANVQPGPPARVTVSMRATAAELRAFYVAALPKYRWAVAGNCWERTNPVSNKVQSACLQTSANSAVLQIAEK